MSCARGLPSKLEPPNSNASLPGTSGRGEPEHQANAQPTSTHWPKSGKCSAESKDQSHENTPQTRITKSHQSASTARGLRNSRPRLGCGLHVRRHLSPMPAICGEANRRRAGRGVPSLEDAQRQNPHARRRGTGSSSCERSCPGTKASALRLRFLTDFNAGIRCQRLLVPPLPNHPKPTEI